MRIPIVKEHDHQKVVGSLRNGTMGFARPIPQEWLPVGIEYRVVESHEEEGTTMITEIEVLAFSVSPRVELKFPREE